MGQVHGVSSFAFRDKLCGRLLIGFDQVEDAAEKSSRRAAIATQLREGLLRLGPTFIKLGQLLSTRCVPRGALE